MPADTSAGNVSLIQIEHMQTRTSHDSVAARNMYIHPIYADTKTNPEYEEIT
jgi:hypothetical protein